MRVPGPNNVERAVQTDPTLFRYASMTWNKRNVGSRLLKSLTGFKLNFAQQLPATCNNIQQGV